jgi:hypothetical protein
MKLAILLSGRVSLALGLILRIMSKQHRAEALKWVRWYHVHYWFMPWKATDLLTSKGLRLHHTSLALIMLGLACYFVVAGLHPLF